MIPTPRLLVLAALGLLLVASQVTQAQPGPTGRVSLPYPANTGNVTILPDGSGVEWIAFRATDGPYAGSAVLMRREGQALICVLCDLPDAYGTPELYYLADGRARFSSVTRNGVTALWWDLGYGWTPVSFLSRARVAPLVEVP